MTQEKDNFASDVLVLVGGTTFSQIILIIAYPLLTRLYGPDDFGTYALLLSITTVIGTIACMRYELAILLPKSDDDAINLLGLSLLIVLIITTITVALISIFKESLSLSIRSPQIENYLFLIPLYVLVNGVFLALNYWNSRTKNFKRLSLVQICNSLSVTGAQLASSLAAFSTGGGLILGNLAGQSFSTIVLSSQIWKSNKVEFKSCINLQKMFTVLKRYWKFPLISSWSSLLNIISWQIPTFLLAFFFSPTIVGFYALGFRIIQLPMNLIVSSLSEVFFQRASKARHEGTLDSLVENVLKLLIVMCMFPILILTTVGDDVFSVFFGQEWVEAGVYAQILSIWALVWFISSPISTIFSVLEIQQYELPFIFLNVVTRLLSLVIGGLMGNARIALLLFSISGVLVYGYLLSRIMFFSGVKTSNILKIILSSLLRFIPAGIILLFVKLAAVNQIFIVAIAIILIVIYYIYILANNEDINIITKDLHIYEKMPGFMKK